MKKTDTYKMAYLVSRFPKTTETFILYEVLALLKSDYRILVGSLLKPKKQIRHPGASTLAELSIYVSIFNPMLWVNHLKYLFKSPSAYLGSFWVLLTHCWRSPRFLLKCIYFFGKAPLFASRFQNAGIQHIHAHFATFPAITAFIIHKLTGIPYSFTAHGSDIHVRKHRLMLYPVCENARFIRTISLFNRHFILAHTHLKFEPKVKVVHCGIDLRKFVPSERKAVTADLHIVCVASFEEVKGHKYLLKACGLLKQKTERFRLHLIGDGPLKKAVRKQAWELGLSNQITFYGALNQKSVIAILQQMHVKVLPSVPTARGDLEGIPVALMEAMAIGLPVVSTKQSGIPELVEHEVNGFLVEPRDVESLAAILHFLYQFPDIRWEMGLRGRKKVMEEFDLFKNIRELQKLFTITLQAEQETPVHSARIPQSVN
ncbi:MAG: glycosyltransferase family 4 protein [Calditrichia bacterium]